MRYEGHDNRREHILTAAAGLLSESGAARLSVRAVSEAAGVGMGTLRHYFPTQKELHHALVVKLVDQEIREFEIHDSRLPADVRLRRCMLQFVPSDKESMPLLEVWFGLYRVGLDPMGTPFNRQLLEVSAARSREQIRRWLELLAEEGHLPWESLTMHVLRLSSLVSGLCLELVTPGSDMTPKDAQSIVTEMVSSILRSEALDD